MWDVYAGKSMPGYYDHFMIFARIYLTRMSNPHYPYALWRNLVFNFAREGWCYTYWRVFFDWANCGHHTVAYFGRYYCPWIVFYTVLFNYTPMELLYKLKYFHFWVRTEYFVSFPSGCITLLNLLNHSDHYRGDIFAMIVITVI